jgi:hypothetical protein
MVRGRQDRRHQAVRSARRSICLSSPFAGEGSSIRASEIAGWRSAVASMMIPLTSGDGFRAMADEEDDEFSEEDFDDDFDDDFEEDLDDDLKEFEDSIETAPEDGDDDDEVGEPFEEEDDF